MIQLIKLNLSSEIFEDGYQFVLFDIVSQLMNVSLNKTINIILDQIYRQKLLKTNLKKRAMKKLSLDSCTKTTFSYDNVIYWLCEGVSMSSSLAPVQAKYYFNRIWSCCDASHEKRNLKTLL